MGLGFKVCRVYGLGFRVIWGLGFRVIGGFGCRVFGDLASPQAQLQKGYLVQSLGSKRVICAPTKIRGTPNTNSPNSRDCLLRTPVRYFLEFANSPVG